MENTLQKLLNEIEKSISDYEKSFGDNKVFTIILAYHTGSFSPASISRQDVEVIYTFLKNKMKFIGNKKVEEFHVILHSGGGDPDAAYQIARIIDRIGNSIANSVVYCIPRFAKSAATLMALGGNRIIMTEIAELGPIDPQIYFEGQWISAKTVRDSMKYMIGTLLDLLREKGGEIDFGNVPGLQQVVNSIVDSIVGRFVGIGEYESLISYIKQLAKELLALRMFKNPLEIDNIVNNLIERYSSHGMVIDYQKAQQLGLRIEKVNDNMEDKLLQIYSNLGNLFKYIDILGSGISEQINPQYIPTYPWNIEHGIIFLPYPNQ